MAATDELWTVHRDDADYPAALRGRLGPAAPALLHGRGPRGLLARPGVAVVGSRRAADAALAAARELGRACAHRGLVLISGGARGADQAAMDGALAAGGAVLGVLAGDLARQPRDETGRLALICAVAPEQPFTVARALARNRLIHALGEAAVVVAVEAGRGGTRGGALAALRAGRRVLVRTGPGAGDGVDELLAAGALPVGDWDLCFGPLLFGAG